MRRVLIFVLAGGVLLALVLTVQIHGITPLHDGRCGSQMWSRHVLWFDESEYDYDEFGIEERWTRAHKISCRHIWLPGILESDRSGYWPALHLKVAQGASLEELVGSINRATDAELRIKDRLGRSLLHWTVVYPTARGRAVLSRLLVARGLSLDEQDLDGLSPQMWGARFNATSQP